jgi:outer membrane protein assembly factor BamB
MVRDDGIASCLDAKTGEQKWQQRLTQGTYRSAAVAGDGKIYFLERGGVCTVIQAGDVGKVLAVNRLSDTFYATPAISDGVLYLRGYRGVYAIKSE